MASMKYPNLINSEDFGCGAIIRGHNLTSEVLADAERAMIGKPGEDEWSKVQEVFYDWHPRIKWCERLSSWECDSAGDWHGHWVEVQPNEHPQTHFTIIYHTDVDPNEEPSDD